jgi:histone-lysine N-methyltransferase SETMAR
MARAYSVFKIVSDSEVGWSVLPHQSYSPDLVPSDFHLFGAVKNNNAMTGCKFKDVDEVIEEVKMWLQQTSEDVYQQETKVLVSRWCKAIQKDGDYVEK